jgi:hypothetical protein
MTVRAELCVVDPRDLRSALAALKLPELQVV